MKAEYMPVSRPQTLAEFTVEDAQRLLDRWLEAFPEAKISNNTHDYLIIEFPAEVDDEG